MQKRLLKLEEARCQIFTKIIRAISSQILSSKKYEIVETFMMIQNQNILIVGKDNRHLMKNLDNQKLEDMLQILQQYNLIQSYERVCGDVFRVVIVFSPKAESSIISISNYRISHLKRA